MPAPEHNSYFIDRGPEPGGGGAVGRAFGETLRV